MSTGKIGDFNSKGGPGNQCARKACNNKPAIGYNRSTGLWYCRECSDLLNKENQRDAERIFGGNLVIIAHDFALEPTKR